ncbi:Putative anti-sigma factor antagonist [Roseivivax sp. THAF40]|uniref:STAS domain-containing protein n=1 Tax=unclassified Roseivivax TaxID=2639302 RepID=UPI0012684320|nr:MULTISPECIES: STAS domain-containing protein [unclassified Roseivivax]QFS84449.1 Putative anti-sigma factor antagonist [Roseivivax sp. THAF197b]QFT48277.1 Putative anti-sigma factor antagonist [Roseivivax sp. THAF40]
MELVARDAESARVITVKADRIDAAVALEFKDAMRAACDAAGPRVLLDLSAVTFIDSSGLGAIVAAMKQLESGQQLELAALNPLVDTVFRLTRMDTIFRIHPTLDDGLSKNAA